MMGLLSLRLLAPIFLSTLTAQQVIAADDQLPTGKVGLVGESHSLPQTGSSVPDRVALRWLARIAAEKPHFAHVLVSMHTDANIDTANRLVAYLGDLHGELMSERRDAESRIACSESRSTPTESDAFRLLDLVDEMHAVVDEKYLLISRADLDSRLLRPLLDDLKKGISVRPVRSREHFRNAPATAAMNTLQVICEARR